MTPVDLPPQQHLTESVVQMVRESGPSLSGSELWIQREPGRKVMVDLSRNAAGWVPWAFGRVNELLSLRDGWDSYGALAVRPESANQAVLFLQQHALGSLSAPSVVPMTDGGVQLEWHVGGVDLEIAFSRSEPGVYIHDLRSGHELESPLADAGRVLTHYRKRLAG